MHKKFLMVAVICTLVSACSRDEDPAAAAAKAQHAATIAGGEKLFNQYCSTCHERRGRGDYLHNIPVTLLNRRSPAELMAWIRGSEKHREMPNFRQLSDEERVQLATFLRAQAGR